MEQEWAKTPEKNRAYFFSFLIAKLIPPHSIAMFNRTELTKKLEYELPKKKRQVTSRQGRNENGHFGQIGGLKLNALGTLELTNN